MSYDKRKNSKSGFGSDASSGVIKGASSVVRAIGFMLLGAVSVKAYENREAITRRANKILKRGK